MAQLINITSEALQATIRRLLPSQQGFGEDLQATNVVTPVIDLTPTAEGSVLEPILQRALAFGSVTAHSVSATTSTLINTTGFFRVFGAVSYDANASSSVVASFTLTDGSTNKIIYSAVGQAPGDTGGVINYDFVVFLAAGESLTATGSTSAISLRGCSRQIADVNGNLVNPSGFVSQ